MPRMDQLRELVRDVRVAHDGSDLRMELYLGPPRDAIARIQNVVTELVALRNR